MYVWLNLSFFFVVVLICRWLICMPIAYGISSKCWCHFCIYFFLLIFLWNENRKSLVPCTSIYAHSTLTRATRDVTAPHSYSKRRNCLQPKNFRCNLVRISTIQIELINVFSGNRTRWTHNTDSHAICGAQRNVRDGARASKRKKNNIKHLQLWSLYVRLNHSHDSYKKLCSERWERMEK